MELLEVYKWYLVEQDLVNDMVAFFAEEVGLSESQSDKLFELIAEERLTSDDFANIIQDNYGNTLCVEVHMDLLEQNTQAALIRKQKIERSRKSLGAQFVSKKGDTDAQRLSKSVRSLTTFKIDQQGRFIQRDKVGNPGKVRSDLEAKRARSKSAKGKTDAAKATEKRKKQVKAGSKIGASKFVQNLKLAA